jgi:hypothetical protein
MASPPSHPDTDGTGAPPASGPSSGPSAGRSRLRTAAIAVLVIAVLAVMVILHLTGTLGAGTHG